MTKESNAAGGSSIKEFLLDHMLIVLLLLLSVVTAIVEPAFLKLDNLSNIMRQFGALSFVALGLTFAIICGFIDLSIPGVINFAAVLSIWLIDPLGQVGALIVTLAFGVLAGVINGMLITKSGGVTQAAALFLTFGMSQVWSAAAMLLSDGRTQQMRWCERDYSLFKFLGSYRLFDFVPIAIIIFGVMLIILNFYQKKTCAGRCMCLSGGNKTASGLAGVHVNRTIIQTMAIAGLMTAVGAVMLTSRVTNASPTVGQGYDNDAILSVVVGGTSLAGGTGSVFGTMLGVLLVTLLSNCMNLLGVSSHLQYVMKGAVLILAIWADARKTMKVK